MIRLNILPGLAKWTLLGVLAVGCFVPVTAQAQTGYSFYAVTPCRVVDTRALMPQQPAPRNTTVTILPPLYPIASEWGGPNDPINPQNFKVRGVGQWDGTGDCGVPTSAVAVSLNATLVTPGSNGNFRIWPYGGTMPTVSTLNPLKTDTAIANGAIVPLPAYNPSNPDISVRFTAYPKESGVHLVLDVTGYFQ